MTMTSRALEAPARTRNRRLSLLAAVAALSACVAFAAETRAFGDAHKGQGFAVVYLRQHSQGPDAIASWQAIWQPSASPASARVVYETGRSPSGTLQNGPDDPPPVGFGILPSPDGRWLHVWESLYHRSGGSFKTVWLVIHLATGRRLKVGELPGGRFGYFPYWLDDCRLALEKGDEGTVFSVKTGRLSHPLSVPDAQPYPFAARDIDGMTGAPVAAWRRQYVRRRYGTELEGLRSATADLAYELGFCAYLRPRTPNESVQPDLPEDFLLRPLGIVAWWRLKTLWPSVAVAPGGRMLARTAFVVTGRNTARAVNRGLGPGPPHRLPLMSAHGRGPQNSVGRYTCDARIDVYTLPAGERLWGRSVPQSLGQDNDTAGYRSRHRLAGDDPWFRDPRWSRDGRYLSFTTRDEPSGKESVSVVDSSTWEVVLHVANATNAFVIPVAE